MTENKAIKILQRDLQIQLENKALPDGIEAIQIAIQALEKQIPKKPRKTDSYRGVLKRVYAYVCPTCGNACLEKYMNERQNTMFCWNCGQKLDWSEENE